MRWQQGDYTVSDEMKLLPMDFIVESLNKTYWAEGRPAGLIKASFENSAVLMVMKGEEPAGFARIVSDYSTFAWLCDVYIAPGHRGKGLGKFLMSCVKAHPSADVRTITLATKDAHGLYEQFGFEKREMMYCRKEYGEIGMG